MGTWDNTQHNARPCKHTCSVSADHLESSQSVPHCTAAAETLMEVRLRDLLLDIEDRIHQGTLGTLQVHTHTHTRLHVKVRSCS